METLLSVDDLAKHLHEVDSMLMLLVKKRMELVDQVGRVKRRDNADIFRPSIEDERIKQAREWAKMHGVNEHFAESLVYLLINEACKRQLIQLQNRAIGVEPETEEEIYQMQKADLLKLTEKAAERPYGTAHFATRSYAELETRLMRADAEGLADRQILLDVGCGTGAASIALHDLFDQVVGYDISPSMVRAATETARTTPETRNLLFKQADVERGIPERDENISFAIMSFGTASDVRDFDFVMGEIMRVLRRGGQFFLSFYNADALVYKWALLPWPAGLAAAVNPHKNCLDVQIENEILSVYARPYKPTEVEDILQKFGATQIEIHTYPAVSAVLPSELFDNQLEVGSSISAIDEELRKSNDKMGAYIIARGRKD